MYDQFFKGLLLACKEVDDCVIDKASAKIDQILSPETATILIKLVGDVSFLVHVRDNGPN